MNLYVAKNQSLESVLVLQFGLGLVGSSILKAFVNSRQIVSNVKKLPFNWVDKNKAEKEFEKMNKILKLHLKEYEVKRIYIIWSAGKAGFNATNEQVLLELYFFKFCINKISKMVKNTFEIKSSFFLMSSAGGLFEGQTLIEKESIPEPKRPYGELKINQENIILENTLFDTVSIFRISSVYSNYNLSGRLGLIAVLVKNGILNRVSTLVGDEYTLRDYILDEDIGRFISDVILSNESLDKITYLINGKPSSILEIKNYIETITLRKLFINYSLAKSNSSNISFSPKLKPSSLIISPIQANIRKLYSILLSKNNIS